MPPFSKITNLALTIAVSAMILALSASLAHAAHSRPDTFAQAYEITVEGIDKTRPGYMKRLVRSCIREVMRQEDELVPGGKGKPCLSKNKLEQCVMNSRHFAKVNANIAPGHVHLAVEERYSLIPMPYASLESDDSRYGGFVFETNFLGMGKNVGLGGSIGDSGNTYLLLYIDKSVMFSDWTLMLWMRGLRERTIAFDREDEIYGFTEIEQGKSISVGYNFTDSFNAALVALGSDRSYERYQNYAEPLGRQSTSLGVKLTYRDTNYRFHFNEGVKASAEISREVEVSEGFAASALAEIKASYETAVHRDHAFQAVARLKGMTNTGRGNCVKNRNGKGTRGVPQLGLWTEWIATASLDYHIPVIRRDSSVWTVAPYLDVATYEPILPGVPGNMASAGLGIYMYLKKVNMPGLGLIAGYNARFESEFVTMFVGMSME